MQYYYKKIKNITTEFFFITKLVIILQKYNIITYVIRWVLYISTHILFEIELNGMDLLQKWY